MICGISRNAPIKRWFRTFKTELVKHRDDHTRVPDKANIHECIKVFHERSRGHPGMGSPLPNVR